MKRDLEALASRRHDLLIVGGGIHGACIARDAALRGLSVAIVDRSDFGSGASQNSLKILHGGLRYLQTADLGRMRTSIRERSVLGRIAPHLVEPLGFLLPLGKGNGPDPLSMLLALRLADLAGHDRNRDLPAEIRIPGGRVVGRRFLRSLGLPDGFDRTRAAALWYDLRARNTERLTLAFLLSACEHGAVAVNHARVERLLRLEDGSIAGVHVADVLDDHRIDVRAKAVVVAAGSWTAEILADLEGRPAPADRPQALALNLLTRRPAPPFAVGFRARETHAGDPAGDRRTYFLVPHRGATILGTFYRLHRGPSDGYEITEALLASLVEECNRAWPELRLRLEEVEGCHHGLLPCDPERGGAPRLAHRPRIRDHAVSNGHPGLISLEGVKYTTARLLGEMVTTMVFDRLGRRSPPCWGRVEALPGGEHGTMRAEEEAAPSEAVARLIRLHGSRYRNLASRGDEEERAWFAPMLPGIKASRAEILHPIREEMAAHLADLVVRRTEIAADGPPDAAALASLAAAIAPELGWSSSRCEDEVAETLAALQPWEEKAWASVR